MERAAALACLSTRILDRPFPPGGVLRLGIDGPDAAGKSTLAAELAARLCQSGCAVVQVSLDGFHNPRDRRYRQGRDGPQGIFEDAFDLEAVFREVLDPLEPGGSHAIRTAVFDYRSDQPAPGEVIQVAPGSILLFEGIFLLRPELRAAWDFSIFVQVSFDTILARALLRDAQAMGSADDVRARYLNRYLPAQQMYLSRFRPDLLADVVLVNDDPQNVEMIFGGTVP